MNKKGITMIILIITVVLIIVLLGITTAGIGNAVQNARMSSFGEDLTLIEDAVNLYYEQTGNFPKLDEEAYTYSSNEMTSTSKTITLDNEFQTDFEEELIANFDKSGGGNVVPDTVFYTIDLSKIDIVKSKRGNLKVNENTDLPDLTDVYVVASPSRTVYYLKGVYADNKMYFSLINISGTKKLNDRAPSEVETQVLDGVKITKTKKTWSNTLGINISARFVTGSEELYVKFPDSVRTSEIKLSTSAGNNSIDINSLDVSLGLTNAEIQAFNTLSQNERYINVIKKENGVTKVTIRVTLANLDIKAPEFPTDMEITSETGYNKLSFTGSDDISGIGEVRYVYLTELTNNANVNTLVENIGTLTKNYMLQNGKKAYVSDNNVDISIPKDIQKIYVMMFDKAGNYVAAQKNVEPDVYIGINPVTLSDTLKLNVVIKSNTTITSATADISENNKNYLDEKALTLTKTGNVYSSTVLFDKANQKEVYIKVVSNDNSVPQHVETRIKKIDLTQVASNLASEVVPGQIYEENRYYTDENGDKAIVPAGFMVSTKNDEQTISKGLVIIDKLDNEFVWIPVDGTNVEYQKNFNYPSNYSASSSNTSDDSDGMPTGIDENIQITKYHGFYIGRYEAGVPANQTAIDGTNASNSDTTGIPQSKKGINVWTSISYTNANTSAKSLYNNSNVKSGLMTGTMWDTTCSWLSYSGYSVSDSRTYGNYNNSLSPANVTGYGIVQKTGYSDYWKANNIYDIAGNVWEWTNEKNSAGNRIDRGGQKSNMGERYPVSFRDNSPISFNNSGLVGFRIALYIM